MFGLIFMWTPPHFWALALFMKSDYHEAKVPMLTVTHGRAETRRQIWIYSLLLAPVALGLGADLRRGPVYLAPPWC
jgi:protoheme IX farnesyltransferase